MEEYKLINEKNKLGVWVSKDALLDIIKVCDKRNKSLQDEVVGWYEYLTGEKFKKEFIANKRKLKKC